MRWSKQCCLAVLIACLFLLGSCGQVAETDAAPLPLSADGTRIQQVFTLDGTFYCLLTENAHSYPLYTFDPEAGTGVKRCEIRSFGAPMLDDGLLYYTDYDDSLTVMAYDIAQNQFRKVMTATAGTRVRVNEVNGDWLALALLTCDENEVIQRSEVILYAQSSGQQVALAKDPETSWHFLDGNSDYFVYYDFPAYSLYALALQTGQSLELAPDPAGRGYNSTYLITEDACYFLEDYTLCRAQLSGNGDLLEADLPRTAGDVLSIQEYGGKLYILTRFAGEILMYVASESLEFLDTRTFALDAPQIVQDFFLCEQGTLFEEGYTYEWVPTQEDA
jgi:hypothetical protein